MESHNRNEIEMVNTTFLIEIFKYIFKYEKHSFQGRMTWVEEHRIRNFRSGLELMKLINSVLNNDCHEKDKD